MELYMTNLKIEDTVRVRPVLQAALDSIDTTV